MREPFDPDFMHETEQRLLAEQRVAAAEQRSLRRAWVAAWLVAVGGLVWLAFVLLGASGCVP